MPRVIFVRPGGERLELDVAAGKSLLDIAWENDIDIEGTCEGALACSTCHVIVDPDFFGRLPDPSEDEDDMLDLAWGLTPTSRLGCQVIVTDDLDGLVVSLPLETNNQMDG